jgi:hypothetical protein
MMSIVTDAGELVDVPVPQEYVQRGVLPPGYAVDFLFDPEEVVAKLTTAGATYMEYVYHLHNVWIIHRGAGDLQKLSLFILQGSASPSLPENGRRCERSRELEDCPSVAL